MKYRVILYQIVYNCQANCLKQLWIIYFSTSIAANKLHQQINQNQYRTATTRTNLLLEMSHMSNFQGFQTHVGN